MGGKHDPVRVVAVGDQQPLVPGNLGAALLQLTGQRTEKRVLGADHRGIADQKGTKVEERLGDAALRCLFLLLIGDGHLIKPLIGWGFIA